MAGKVATVRVGVFEADEALIAETDPRKPAVVVLPSNDTTRPMNWLATTPDAAAPAIANADVGMDVVEAPVLTVPRATAFNVALTVVCEVVSWNVPMTYPTIDTPPSVPVVITIEKMLSVA